MTIIKKATYLVAIAAAAALTTTVASAQTIIDNALPVNDITLQDVDSRLALRFSLQASKLRPASDREFLITPVLVADNSADSAMFTSVLISGRNLYIRHERVNNLDSVCMYRSGKHDVINYSASVPYQQWMDNAVLHFHTIRRGCCDRVKAIYSDEVAKITTNVIDFETFMPAYVCRHDKAAAVADSVKIRDMTGKAFVNFRINSTNLDPQYMSNPDELRRITATIDSVKGDPDITILTIKIKGFASPEGRYANNERLAKGRTISLANHVRNLYNFSPGFIDTAYTAEDWAGLRAYVEGSQLTNRDGLLRIINSDMKPDARDAELKAQFPTEYSHLLATVYPTLRHSDYVITYRVRSYNKVSEIISVLHKAPQKLSREELYRAAATMQPGSDEYIYLVETAVRMYPDDPVWNYNAGIAALHGARYAEAAKYFEKAGDDAEAAYAKGVLAALQKRYDDAEPLLTHAAKAGSPNAPAALEALRQVRLNGNGVRSIQIIENK